MDKHEEDESKRVKMQIKPNDLLCVNGCGFYGTPQWENRCSKCWRAHQNELKRSQDFAKNKSLLSFDQFQERRKSTTESRSRGIKNLFKTSPIPEGGSSSPTSSTSPAGTPTRRRELSPDSLEARKQLTDFLVANLSTAIAQEIARSVKNAVTKISEMRLGPDDMSELVMSYYQYLGERLGNTPSFQQQEHKVKLEDVMDQVEKFVSTCCYSQFFCASHEEEVADVSLQDRIRSLHWVTAGFLETKLVFKKQPVRERVDEAISELIEINAKKSAFEKLECLTRSCKAIFEALKESEAATSADEFLPTLIYILFRGNPPLIQSNVKFISRYAIPARLMSGEAAYFFTNLSCALQFAQNMNHESLQMDKAEFEAYTAGHLAPPLSVINSACNQAMYVLEGTIETIVQVTEKAKSLAINLTGMHGKADDDLEKMLETLKETVDFYPSETYRSMKDSIFEEEKETADILASFSRQSSDSGRGTFADSQPSTPQPQLDADGSPLIAALQSTSLASSEAPDA